MEQWGQSERRNQDDVVIDAVELKQQRGKLPKWKGYEPDDVHGFCIKEFTNIHEKIITHVNNYLEKDKTSRLAW